MDGKRFFLHFVVIAALSLAGCGGNGGGMTAGPDSTPPPTAEERQNAEAVAKAIAPLDTVSMALPNSLEIQLDALTQEASISGGEGSSILAAFLRSEEDPPEIEGLMGIRYWRSQYNDVETVTAYTNVEAPGPQAWLEYYSAGEDSTRITGQDGIAGDADSATGSITLDTDEINALDKLFMVAKRPTESMAYEDDYKDGQEYEGSFNGVMGTYTCAGANGCAIYTDNMGKLATVSGMWTFVPDTGTGMMLEDVMVQGVVPDEDYLDFGYWIKSDDSMGTEVGVFAQGQLPFASGDSEGMAGQVSALEGSAEYEGSAAGMFVTKDTGGPAHSGEFMADVMLTATFGDGAMDKSGGLYQISGSVDNFKLMAGDKMVENDWKLALNPAAFSNSTALVDNMMMETGEYEYDMHTNAFSGMTDGGGDSSGEWRGMFYGEATAAVPDDPMTPMDETMPAGKPSGVAGTFLGHFSDGHALGAFGATIMPEDGGSMSNN